MWRSLNDKATSGLDLQSSATGPTCSMLITPVMIGKAQTCIQTYSLLCYFKYHPNFLLLPLFQYIQMKSNF